MSQVYYNFEEISLEFSGLHEEVMKLEGLTTEPVPPSQENVPSPNPTFSPAEDVTVS